MFKILNFFLLNSLSGFKHCSDYQIFIFLKNYSDTVGWKFGAGRNCGSGQSIRQYELGGYGKNRK